MSARKAVLEILQAYDRRPGRLENFLERSTRVQRLDQRDRRFLVEMLYGIVRRDRTLDFLLDRFLSTARLRQNAALVRLLKLGLYQILYMDRVPAHAAVNESVRLAKADPATAACAGVVNAVLRNVIKSKKHLPRPAQSDALSFRLSIEYSHPEWFIERLLGRLGLAKTKSLLAFNNTPPDIYLRRRIRGMSTPQFDAEARSICDAGKGYRGLFYRLKKRVPPESIRLLKEGFCTVQSPSSGWTVAMLGAGPGERILDLCAAPGGKTSLVSELVGGRGAVVSCDISGRRMRMVAETAGRMSLDNVYLVATDGTRPSFKTTFDRVILDAPCSGTGVFNRHPEARWTRTPEDIARITGLQMRLLEGAATLVRPGGVLVYATCSLEPEENEERVAAFIASRDDFEPDHAPADIPGTYITAGGHCMVRPEEHGLEGMFAARLRRKA
ncbi:MAG: 16S rRNA (cytosine(967)-C(5))-methyltransferase RsmB [Chitinivibrionales bacterium]|nr:16S rRNA (cytosine(967)-C(5))-methyltransferase RsmB [Chitinivibrionales bacterium]MBD3395054.1 16S rRNA (cytosine(967)-C(5))-methyltransferase RsmB [Chitinivibrionales bacterium]